jgi:hypothetical protein
MTQNSLPGSPLVFCNAAPVQADQHWLLSQHTMLLWPVAGLSFAGGEAVDPSKTLVLAVHDAGGMESPDFQVCIAGRGASVCIYVRVVVVVVLMCVFGGGGIWSLPCVGWPGEGGGHAQAIAGGEAVDPSKTLVLAIHDACGMESPDFQVW